MFLFRDSVLNHLHKDQYKLVADVNQLIYDGGVIKATKRITAIKC